MDKFMKIIQFIKRVLLSRIGLGLAFLNIVLSIYAWDDRGGSRSSIDLRYESWLFIVLDLLNSPMTSLASGLGIVSLTMVENRVDPAFMVRFGEFNAVSYIIFFASFAFYWLLIGYAIEKIIKKLIAARNNKPL
jgi:hypothetical protein